MLKVLPLNHVCTVALGSEIPPHGMQCAGPSVGKVGGRASLQPPWGINYVINRNQCARHVRLRLSHKTQKCTLNTVKIADSRAMRVLLRAPGPGRATRVPPSAANRRAASSFNFIVILWKQSSFPLARDRHLSDSACRCHWGRVLPLLFKHQHRL